MATGKNKVVHSEGREIVSKVIQYFDEEKKNNKPTFPLSQSTKRAAAATGKSESFIKKVRKEKKTADESGTKLSTPGKDRIVHKKIILDDMDKCIMRRKIQEYYLMKKQVPTLKKLRCVLKDEMNYRGSREHLRNTLHSIGFRFRKCYKKRKLLLERSDIVFKRSVYLTELHKNDKLLDNKRPVIFLDETYIHPSYTVKKCWQDDSTNGVMTSDSVGQRWIIIHAGSKEGFVPGALCMFKSKTKSGDYHDEMNSKNFDTWLRTQLVPNIPPNCIVVMDNAPYHSTQINKPPTSISKKHEIEMWLTANNIPFLEGTRKINLIPLIKAHKPAPVYAVDTYLKSMGHTVVRLPPYHCDLNPIEYIWSLVKRRVADKNVEQSTNDIERLTKEAFNTVTSEEWEKMCKHVDRLCEEYWTRYGLLDETENIIIHVGDDSDSETESDSDGDNSSSDDSSCSVMSGVQGID